MNTARASSFASFFASPFTSSIASAFRTASLLSVALSAALLPACGGNVVVDEPSGGGNGGGGTSTATVPCPPMSTACGSQCVDIDNDAQNCGGCGIECSSGSCFLGSCVTPPTCPPDLVPCGNDCVDTNFDPQNCGGCGVACPGGSDCFGGECGPQKCFCGGICSWFDIGSNVPQSLNLKAGELLDSFSLSCGPTGWPDATFLFTAPFDGTFEFKSVGMVDTVIQVMNPGCEVFVCNESANNNNLTVATAALAAGQTVLVVVEALATGGNFTFSVAAPGQGPGCLPCSEFVSTPDPAFPLCGQSVPLYDALFTCLCEGACGPQCEAPCAGTGDATEECQTCITDPVDGCGKEVDACFADI